MVFDAPPRETLRASRPEPFVGYRRALAAKQLGAACPLALVPPDRDELAATLQDWLDEFERIQLMLLLSARLRQKHGD